jgi:UDP-N-acetylglucosamine 1-carboxyvinyltransferase
MDSFLIKGGTKLSGRVDVSGSKNSALPILAATLMAEGRTTLKMVPRLSDTESMIKLIGQLGCSTLRHDSVGVPGSSGPALNGDLEIEVVDERNSEAHYDIVKTMRASICVLGPLLAKRGRAVVSLPGGCAIGDRPVDLHVRGLQKLGAEFHFDGGNIVGTVKGRLKGCRMYLGGSLGPTVLGTINVMSAAALAEGETIIVGAACEPEVTDCAEMLNKMGARIRGAGTPELRIEGVDRLRGVEHRVIPDRIEAGTFVIAAAITGGTLDVCGANADHLLAVTDRLEEAGVRISVPEAGVIRVSAPPAGGLKAVEMTTQPYPGFPTDIQAQLMALLCVADGNSVITERIFPDRFLHVGELNRMGARIRKDGPTAVIQGVAELSGATVMCSDLRASAALVLAGMAAKGTTRLDRVYHIDRGYEKIEQKLAAVGADIERVKVK